MFVFLLEDETPGTRDNTEADVLAQTSEDASPSLDEMNIQTVNGEIRINVKYTILEHQWDTGRVAPLVGFACCRKMENLINVTHRQNIFCLH